MSIVANFEHLANIGVAAGFIIILTQDLHGKGHVVFADRYYTSPRLMEYLGKVDMDVCGTVRKMTKTTPKIHIKKMERKLPGFLECCQCSKTVMAAYGWKKNPIYTFCQMHRSEEHTSELQSPDHLVCRLLLEKKKYTHILLQTIIFHIYQKQ